MYFRDRFIGRPGVDVLAAHVSPAGNADYLELRNVDWRSATDSSYFTTQFQQGSLNIQQDIGDQLKMDVLFGRSRSTNDNQAFLVEFNRMDSPETFTLRRARSRLDAAISYGFDVADPNNWSLVKGFSTLRHFERETDNDYQGGHLNFELKVTDTLRLEFGGTRREYKFKTNQAQRLSNEIINPTLAELGLTAADLGRVYDFGDGLDRARRRAELVLRAEHRRVSRGHRLRLQLRQRVRRLAPVVLSNPGNQFGVEEFDTSYFVQVNWDFELFGRRLFGNFGIRTADTRVVSSGFTTNVAATGPRPLEARHDYTDDLPSLNIAYQLTDTLMLRGGCAKVMARPLLSKLAPSITGLTTPDRAGPGGPAHDRQSRALSVPRHQLRSEPRVVLQRRRPAVRGRASRRTCPTSRRRSRPPARSSTC